MIAVVIAVCLLVGVMGWRALEVRRQRQIDQHAIEIQRLTQDREHRTRELAIKEREIAVIERKEPRPIQPPAPSEFPPDILSVAGGESEGWAREDALQLISEAYVESAGDWSRAKVYLTSKYIAQPTSRLPKELLS